jgi:predicted metal-binding protein
MIDREELIAIALRAGASHAGILETSAIEFHEDFRKACERNFCRKYDTNWMGPPAVGPVAELRRRVLAFAEGMLFQSTHPVQGNFDMKGIDAAARAHDAVFRELVRALRARYPAEAILPLGAGCCSVCGRCAYLDGEPCRRPDLAASSVEAYGMNVIALQKRAGLPYYFGKTAVCFVGLILYAPASGAPASGAPASGAPAASGSDTGSSSR